MGYAHEHTQHEAAWDVFEYSARTERDQIVLRGNLPGSNLFRVWEEGGVDGTMVPVHERWGYILSIHCYTGTSTS